MKKAICAVMVISLLLSFCSSALAVSSCEHLHEYYSGSKIEYERDEAGHHKREYEIYYCPTCNSEEWRLISVTFEGHTWSYEDQEHFRDRQEHEVYYMCYFCGSTYTAKYKCTQWPCAIRYYSFRPVMEMY